jgi:hypothetical protein
MAQESAVVLPEPSRRMLGGNMRYRAAFGSPVPFKPAYLRACVVWS